MIRSLTRKRVSDNGPIFGPWSPGKVLSVPICTDEDLVFLYASLLLDTHHDCPFFRAHSRVPLPPRPRICTCTTRNDAANHLSDVWDSWESPLKEELYERALHQAGDKRAAKGRGLSVPRFLDVFAGR